MPPPNNWSFRREYRLLDDNETAQQQPAEISDTGISGIRSAERRIATLLSDYELKTIERTALPSVWVWAFLASLIVLVAHTLYQIWAPALVRGAELRQPLSDCGKRAEEPAGLRQ
jgi:hypothetical protein